MSYIGVDVSYANGRVNLATAKQHGLRFCMIRLGFGENKTSQDDIQFLNNYYQCKKLDIPCGGYFYTYALNLQSVESEKEHIRRLLTGKKFELPIFIDLEDADGYKNKHGGIPSKQMNTNIAKALCSFIVSLGFKAGYYCNSNWCSEYLDQSQLTAYDFWYARPSVSKPDRNCSIWQNQFGELGGNFAGIGKCDTNVCFKNYFNTVATQFKSDTNGTFSLQPFGEYQFKITANGMPNLVSGNTNLLKTQFVKQIGNNYYIKVISSGGIGSVGIYINNKRIAIANIAYLPFKSDTNCTVNIKKGQCYQAKITCLRKPSICCGTPNVLKVDFVKQEGQDWFVKFTAIGNIGQASGVYINGSKQAVFVGKVI